MKTNDLFPTVGLPLWAAAESPASSPSSSSSPAAPCGHGTDEEKDEEPEPEPARRTLAELVDAHYPRRKGYGWRYQNGVKPGPAKLAQFLECLRLQNTPGIYSQAALGEDAIVHVKLFNPAGAGTWFLTEWNGDDAEPQAFGLCCLHEAALGYMDLREMAGLPGRFGIGLELDMHFTPQPLREARQELPAR